MFDLNTYTELWSLVLGKCCFSFRQENLFC